MGRVVGGGFRVGNSCTPVADSCHCMAKPIQYCKVKKKKKALFQYAAKTDKTLLQKEKHQCKLPWQVHIFSMLNNFNSALHNNIVIGL